jgi:hypothetical protein
MMKEGRTKEKKYSYKKEALYLRKQYSTKATGERAYQGASHLYFTGT